MPGASAQATDAARKTAEAATIGDFRPVLSEIAPKTRLPSAMPNMNPEMVSCAIAGVVPSSSVIVGMAGKYMSMPKGATEEKNARATNSPGESFCTAGTIPV